MAIPSICGNVLLWGFKLRILYLLFFLPSLIGATASVKLDQLALKALEKENFQIQKGRVMLYGFQTNGPETLNGQWACAQVASIVLYRAGLIPHRVLAVSQIESQLKGWQQIQSEDSLQPGDVVVYTNRFKRVKDGICTGGGTCHVGIWTQKGLFHNSPLAKQPTFGGISLWGFKFKKAYRIPPKS